MPRNLLLTAVSLFAWGLGEGMFLYFQPLYLQKWGANPVEIGGILGVMGVVMVAVQAPAGYLADRLGPRRIMWAAWVMGTISTILMAMAASLSMFVAGMIAYGMTSFVTAPLNSYIISVRGDWGVERALTRVSALYNFGSVAGPVAGGLVGEHLGLPVVYRISAGFFLLSTLIIFLIRQPEEEVEVSAPPPLIMIDAVEKKRLGRGLTTNPRFLGLLGIAMITMFALYLPQPLTPNYLQNQHGFNLATIGWMGTVGNLGNAVLMLTMGHLSAPVGYLAGQALVAVFALLMWVSNSPAWFFTGYFFIGGYRLSRAMVIALARRLVKPGETGLAFGLMETANSISAITAPLAAGFLYKFNPQYIYIASLAGIGAVIFVNISFIPWLHPVTRDKTASDEVSGESPARPDIYK